MQLELEKAQKEVLNFMNCTEKEPEHVTQVRKLSLLLFDQLHPTGTLIERFVLESAALLHDIGWAIRPTGTKHHKASEQMISEHAWRTVPNDLVQIISNIARYHRKSPPKPTHSRYCSLNRKHQNMVRRLAALLRLGDAMDRSHMQLIRTFRCTNIKNRVIINAISDGELTVEQFGIQKKSDLFETEFSMPVQLLRVSKLED